LKIGLQVPRFTWQGGAAIIGPKLAEIARTADAHGFRHPLGALMRPAGLLDEEKYDPHGQELHCSTQVEGIYRV